MRRPLSDAEIGQLQAALLAESVPVGPLRPWFWRRGWLVPVPLYLPVPLDRFIIVIVACLLLQVFAVPATAAMPAVCFADYIFSDGWTEGHPLRPAERYIVLGCIACIIALALWFWPQHPPSIAALVLGLPGGAAFFTVYAAFVTWGHRRLRRDRAPSSWPDYVEQALVTERF